MAAGEIEIRVVYDISSNVVGRIAAICFAENEENISGEIKGA